MRSSLLALTLVLALPALAAAQARSSYDPALLGSWRSSGPTETVTLTFGENSNAYYEVGVKNAPKVNGRARPLFAVDGVYEIPSPGTIRITIHQMLHADALYWGYRVKGTYLTIVDENGSTSIFRKL